MKKMMLAAMLLILAAIPSLAQVADGDAHWVARAEGATGGHAKGQENDAAISNYQKAVAANPHDLEARWKLMRSLRFKGSYVATDTEEKKKIYDEAKKVGDQAVNEIDRMLASKGMKSSSKASEKDLATAARSIPNAGEVYFWDSANWGEWALVYGKLAAVRQGAADRIKRESTVAMLVDPKLEGGGGARVLGRLHNQTPHVPFITGWASDELAVKYLKQSLAADPTNKITRVFLAEAMVSVNSDTKPQAIQMLHEIINSPNDQNYAVEQADAQDMARKLLKTWGVK
jgi:tetratricopeptide (TPR) repeat protein